MLLQPSSLRTSVCATCRLRACIAGLRDQRARGFASRVVGESNRIRHALRRGSVVNTQTVMRGPSKQSISTSPARAKNEDIHSASARPEVLPVDDNGHEIILDKRDDGVWELDEELEQELSSSGRNGENVGDGEDGEEEYITTAELNENKRLLDELRAAQMGYALKEQDEAADALSTDHTQRTHPLTAANRFGTSPSTLALPSDSLVEPIAAQLANVPSVHLTEAAHRIFGGIGLPYSTSSPYRAKTMQQKPIALDAAQNKMSEMEGHVYMAALMPGIYASVMSVLVETRKRLGTAWAEEMVRKAAAGELRILDAGGAGAGVLAVREMLRAEWERMHEENAPDSGFALAEADGKLGGPGASPPLGIATVLTASDALRHRASRLLENTTFVPRLPDYAHTEEAKKKGKFDLVIAPHTLWPLREDYIRRPHLDNLWSLLSIDGGVLVMLEKGNARGFEMIAGARDFLLKNRIASPSFSLNTDPDEIGGESETAGASDVESVNRKETCCIIAPCTNHSSCPMYKPQGPLKGRSDICHFSQRYLRTPIQQRILRARDKNFEDVYFSYLAVQRGRDLREQHGIQQDVDATDASFAGYENGIPPAVGQGTVDPNSNNNNNNTTTNPMIHSLSLPRAILPPLKRRGHVILDLCTPSGTLERWTVPRSFGKQAFRDARKSEWGDLWALGAKTRILRTPRNRNRHQASPAGKARAPRDQDRVAAEMMAEEVVAELQEEDGDVVEGFDADEEGGQSFDVEGAEDEEGVEGGSPTGSGTSGHGQASKKMTRGRKIKGIREKRDKKGDGRGRRKNKVRNAE